jgi:DNA-binding transcriptional regulator YdaS (Cro superfamily)
MSKNSRPVALLYAAQKCGGMAQLAAELGIARQAIYQWKRVPVDRVVEIERITGVSRNELRPDIFEVAQ